MHDPAARPPAGSDAESDAGLSASAVRFLDRSIPEAVKRDPDELRRSRVLVGLSVVSIITAFGVGLPRAFTEGPNISSISALIGGLAIAGSWFAFSRGLRRTVAGDVLLLLSAVAMVAAGLPDGGLRSQATPWFAALPLVANFIGGRIRALAAWAIGVAGLLLFFVAEVGGWIPAGSEDLPLLAVRLGAMLGLISYVAAGTHLYELSRRDAEADRARLDRLRSEWISVVSHELRTPLTSMHGALKLLDQGVTGELPERAREVVALANRNCDRLNRLVDDVLDIERIEAGALELRVEDVDVRQIVGDAVAANLGFAREHHVSLELDAGDDVGRVRADPDRVVQVLDNLLSNAVKFSPAGEAVHVSVAPDATGVRVSIRDQGPGIPDEFRARIFQRFAQANAAQTREQGGSGLGLSICKGLVERHGGEIGFRNEPEGGTTSFFTLRRHGPTARAATRVVRTT